MSARDVIAEYLDHEFGAAAGDEADAILAALSGDSYRILAKGELDGVTLEEAANVVTKMGRCYDGLEAWTRPINADKAAHAIRNLRSAG